jgi:predicted helicase
MELFEYGRGSPSALEWIIDQYQVRTDSLLSEATIRVAATQLWTS